MTETTDLPEPPAAKSDTPITDEAVREVLGKADRLNAEEWQRKFGMLINRMAQMERQLKPMNGNAIAADSNLLDFAYPTLEAFEKIVGYEVNDTFKDGWRMARTTNAQLGITPEPPATKSDTPTTDACLKGCNQNTFDVGINDLRKMYQCAKDLELRLRRAQWLIGQVVNDLPKQRDWLNPDYEREMREIGGTL